MSNARTFCGVIDLKEYEKSKKQILSELKKLCNKYSEAFIYKATNRYFSDRKIQIKSEKEIKRLENQLKELKKGR